MPDLERVPSVFRSEIALLSIASRIEIVVVDPVEEDGMDAYESLRTKKTFAEKPAKVSMD